MSLVPVNRSVTPLTCKDCQQPIKRGLVPRRTLPGLPSTSRPTARDFANYATTDGDFQYAELTQDSEFVFKRVTDITNAEDLIVSRRTRERFVRVGMFPSVRESVGMLESWELEGCMNRKREAA